MNANKNVWTALAACAVGAFVMLVGLRIIPSNESDFHAPHWVVTAAGLAFVCAGIAAGLGADQQTWRRIVVELAVLAIVAAFAAIAGWIGFGPGARHFEGGLPFISAAANDAVGRVLFGGVGVLFGVAGVAMVIAMLRRWGRDAAAERAVSN
ncbi:MAG: hypothetical protein QM759_12645 [Terricaulis sp.]